MPKYITVNSIKLEKLRFIAKETGDIFVDPSKYEEVKRKCLRIPNLKDRNQITFKRLKDGQLVAGCAVMTIYRAHYTVLHSYIEELLLSEEFKFLGNDSEPLDDPDEPYTVEYNINKEEQQLQIQAGAIFKLERVYPEDPRYFECRAFCYGSEDSVILIHHSAIIALDIEMRREVIKLINREGLVEHCQLFDFRPSEQPKPSKKKPPYPVIFA